MEDFKLEKCYHVLNLGKQEQCSKIVLELSMVSLAKLWFDLVYFDMHHLDFFLI